MQESQSANSPTVADIPGANVEPVVTVGRGDTLERAVTLMRLNDFSQLAVVGRPKNGNGKGLVPEGAISWESIGRAMSENPSAALRDCIDREAPRISVEGDLFEAISQIREHGYVLVIDQRDAKRGRLSGIITHADLGDVLAGIARPYLLVEQLERLLRELLEVCVEKGWVATSDFPAADTDSRPSADDLTLGQLQKLTVDRELLWQKIQPGNDRSVVATALSLATQLRNKLMHFRELETAEHRTLEQLPQLVLLVEDILAKAKLR